MADPQVVTAEGDVGQAVGPVGVGAGAGQGRGLHLLAQEVDGLLGHVELGDHQGALQGRPGAGVDHVPAHLPAPVEVQLRAQLPAGRDHDPRALGHGVARRLHHDPVPAGPHALDPEGPIGVVHRLGPGPGHLGELHRPAPPQGVAGHGSAGGPVQHAAYEDPGPRGLRPRPGGAGGGARWVPTGGRLGPGQQGPQEPARLEQVIPGSQGPGHPVQAVEPGPARGELHHQHGARGVGSGDQVPLVQLPRIQVGQVQGTPADLQTAFAGGDPGREAPHQGQAARPVVQGQDTLPGAQGDAAAGANYQPGFWPGFWPGRPRAGELGHEAQGHPATVRRLHLHVGGGRVEGQLQPGAGAPGPVRGTAPGHLARGQDPVRVGGELDRCTAQIPEQGGEGGQDQEARRRGDPGPAVGGAISLSGTLPGSLPASFPWAPPDSPQDLLAECAGEGRSGSHRVVGPPQQGGKVALEQRAHGSSPRLRARSLKTRAKACRARCRVDSAAFRWRPAARARSGTERPSTYFATRTSR